MLTIVLQYYNNRTAVENQFKIFSTYGEDCLRTMKFIMVDDCSDESERVDYGRMLIDLGINTLDIVTYEVTDRISWNQAGARNLGCFQAKTDWLFCTDIDHTLPKEYLQRLLAYLNSGLDRNTLYRVNRRDEEGKTISQHINTILVNRDAFIEVGGYDEDFAGSYGYGDKYFLHRWNRTGRDARVLDNVYVCVDGNARTRGLSRDRDRNALLYRMKVAGEIAENTNRINFAWRVAFKNQPGAMRESSVGRRSYLGSGCVRSTAVPNETIGVTATADAPGSPVARLIIGEGFWQGITVGHDRAIRPGDEWGGTHCASTATDIVLSSITLDPRINPVRTPDTPPELRSATFERNYDYLTFAYDLFWDRDLTRVHMLGPVAPRGIDLDRDLAFRALPSGTLVPFTLVPGDVRYHSRYTVWPPSGTSALEVCFGNQTAVRAIQPNNAATFAGRRVLMTLSRDNPLEWIVDWARFHAVHFGVDGVLLYDNGSTRYAPEDVRSALSMVPGLRTVVVVSWPFPYGPTARQGKFDGFWCQPAFLDHARRRLLADAAWVLNLDIDELLVQTGETRLEDIVEHSSDNWIGFLEGRVVNTNPESGALPRHRDFHWRQAHVDSPRASIRSYKWLAFPGRTPEGARWDVHAIHHAGTYHLADAGAFRVCNFLPITTGWGGRKVRQRAVDVTSGDYVEDLVLRERLDRAFADWDPHVVPWTPRH